MLGGTRGTGRTGPNRMVHLPPEPEGNSQGPPVACTSPVRPLRISPGRRSTTVGNPGHPGAGQRPGDQVAGAAGRPWPGPSCGSSGSVGSHVALHRAVEARLRRSLPEEFERGGGSVSGSHPDDEAGTRNECRPSTRQGGRGYAGGVFEWWSGGLPGGLGSHVSWDSRLDGSAGTGGSIEASPGRVKGWNWGSVRRGPCARAAGARFPSFRHPARSGPGGLGRSSTAPAALGGGITNRRSPSWSGEP